MVDYGNASVLINKYFMKFKSDTDIFYQNQKEFQMKTLQYGLTTIFLTASLSVVAEPLK